MDNLKNKLQELIHREYVLFQQTQSNPNYSTTPEGHCALEQWIDDVDIVNQKYLTEHPLHQRIKTIVFHRNNNAITDLVACLNSILNDKEYLGDDGEGNMKDYEILLTKIIEIADQNDPYIFQFEYKPNERTLIDKLEQLGLIERKQYFGMNFVRFNVTYDGLHYFDEREKLEDNFKIEKYSVYPKYDVFISHASKDKLDYVEQLKASLDRLDINIFYDKDSIKWGDKWKQRILEGVASAEFAIIVISENFFGREWTEKELNELLNKQNDSGQKIILPLLHNITVKQLEEKYPEVADIQAINSSDYNLDDITYLFAEQLIKRLKEQRA